MPEERAHGRGLCRGAGGAESHSQVEEAQFRSISTIETGVATPEPLLWAVAAGSLRVVAPKAHKRDLLSQSVRRKFRDGVTRANVGGWAWAGIATQLGGADVEESSRGTFHPVGTGRRRVGRRQGLVDPVTVPGTWDLTRGAGYSNGVPAGMGDRGNWRFELNLLPSY